MVFFIIDNFFFFKLHISTVIILRRVISNNDRSRLSFCGFWFKYFFSSRASELILKRLSPYQTGLRRFDLDLQNFLVHYKHFGNARPQFHSQS